MAAFRDGGNLVTLHKGVGLEDSFAMYNTQDMNNECMDYNSTFIPQLSPEHHRLCYQIIRSHS